MNQQMLWGTMLFLSDHQWADEHTPAGGWYYNNPYNENISTEIDAWDKIVAFMAERKYNLALIDVGDGIKYESHPEISAPNAWDKDFLKKKLAEMRALGIEPIPKLNFSTAHDTWMKQYRRMVSTPTYYQFCADVIREVAEVFDYPRFFHIGCDEENEAHQKHYEMVIIRHKELWWHDFYFLCKEVEKHGARPWIWSDYIWQHGDEFLSNMPKSVLQSNWYYGPFKDNCEDWQKRRIECYEILNARGYDQIPVPSSWTIQGNIYQTVAFGQDKLDPALLKGFLVAPWAPTNDTGIYTLFNDTHRLYLARKQLYPDTLK